MLEGTGAYDHIEGRRIERKSTALKHDINVLPFGLIHPSKKMDGENILRVNPV